MKLADVTPSHKKGRKDLKENNRAVSILSNLSKVLERIMFAQRCFLKMPMRISERLQYSILPFNNVIKMAKNDDKRKVFGALLTHLSKAFDCLDHELLKAKLNALRFNLPA